jgi:hypothetical protein
MLFGCEKPAYFFTFQRDSVGGFSEDGREYELNLQSH